MSRTVFLILPVAFEVAVLVGRWALRSLADGRVDSEERMILVRMLVEYAAGLTGQRVLIADGAEPMDVARADARVAVTGAPLLGDDRRYAGLPDQS